MHTYHGFAFSFRIFDLDVAIQASVSVQDPESALDDPMILKVDGLTHNIVQ